MLDGIRKVTQHGVGRVVMTFLLGLLIVAFAAWGIGDMFRGFTSDKVAQVGSTAITGREFQNEFQNIVYRYQRMYKIPLTNAQARAQGIDMQVLARLIDEAALNQRARSLGLGLSDAAIAEAVRSDPHLQDASGQFNREIFNSALRDSGLSEAGFFAKQRGMYLRQQMQYALADGLIAPKPLVAALAGEESQSRDIDYFVLPPSAAGDIPPPSAEALKTFFDERKESYRAEEYRAVDILLVTPSTLAKPNEVTDEDAKAEYDATKDQRYVVAEKRAIQQVVFPTEADASAAEGQIKSGASFDDIAKARNLSASDLDLGELAKTEIAEVDPAIADAAFTLKEGQPSEVVKGKFGFLIVRVTKIIPGSVKPFDEVKDEVKKLIATRRAASEVQDIHDKIEDQRVAGKSLAEAAKAVGLETRFIPAIDASGRDPNGAAVDLPESKTLVSAVFASDVGVDDAALNTHDRGFLWFDVAKVEPAHDRTFEEVKDKVESQWRQEEVAKALSAKANDLVKQLDAGAAIADLAKSLSLEVKSATGIRRNAEGAVPESVAVAVFAHTADKAGSADTPEGRYVFKVTKDETPAFDPAAPGVKSLEDKLGETLQSDVISQYLFALRNQLGVTVNQRTLQAAEGG